MYMNLKKQTLIPSNIRQNNVGIKEGASDCCLTSIQQCFSYIMVRTSYFSWWGSLCIRQHA